MIAFISIINGYELDLCRKKKLSTILFVTKLYKYKAARVIKGETGIIYPVVRKYSSIQVCV